MVFRDVTEKTLMEDKLLKVRKLESVGVLAGGIAHDFNNILVAILGNISLAVELLDPEEKSRSLLLDAEKASLRAKDLTRQLLTFAKGGEPVKETASVAEIITDSANFSVHGSKVVCRYEIPDDLWHADIDRGQMSQVIQNLALNARQAMPEGGVIDIRCENLSADNLKSVPLPRREYVKISITDSGVGVPEENLERLFDPFFSTKKDGSGLGLSVTHSIVEQHGGHISVTSRLGVGTSFQIYLPAESSRRSTESGESAPPLNIQGKGRILVMDDEEIVRDVAREMLTHLGYEVIAVGDGEAALEAFRRSKEEGRPLDLVIMDLTIPGGMGGKEAVQQLLALDPDAKVIVSSGYSNDPIMANFRKYGFREAVLKPYRIEEMGAMVQKALVE
jgi:nitrogen-specific signal transduction histidine kinase/CheY-like chemotaxis protein